MLSAKSYSANAGSKGRLRVRPSEHHGPLSPSSRFRPNPHDHPGGTKAHITWIIDAAAAVKRNIFKVAVHLVGRSEHGRQWLAALPVIKTCCRRCAMVIFYSCISAYVKTDRGSNSASAAASIQMGRSQWARKDTFHDGDSRRHSHDSSVAEPRHTRRGNPPTCRVVRPIVLQ